MKRTKRIAAGVASLAMVASMALSMPLGASAAGTNYGDNALVTGASYTDNFHSATFTDTKKTADTSDDTPHTSYNAMTLKKVLIIEDDANIPKSSFTFTPTVPTTDVDSTTGVYIPATTTTLAVLAGKNPSAITWKLLTVDSTADDFKADNTTSDTGLSVSSGVATMTYASQIVSLANKSVTAANAKKAVDDNVLVSSAGANDGNYYAIKTLQLDFSACGFTEPGVYRYYIQESGTNSGITNDTGVTVATDKTWRTVDVYVEDATGYATADATTATKKLVIAGYVMYTGKLEKTATAGENAPKNDATTNSISAATVGTVLEDGLSNSITGSSLSGTTELYGGTNNAEAGTTKSEGFQNTFKTHKLTFKKLVTGNQGSKDKYFAFKVQLDSTAGAQVDDGDKFTIVVAESDFDKSVATANRATIYPTTTIGTANNVTEVTGAQLKAGYTFYLQDSQYITIGGLPDGVKYTMTEYIEDYNPTVALTSGTGFDNVVAATGSDAFASSDVTITQTGEVSAWTAAYTDNGLTDNAYATFTNDRSGTIPTGILLSVAAPAGVGIVVIGGIAYLLIKNKRRKAEEE